MRITVKPPDGVRWCMQTIAEDVGNRTMVERSIMLIQERGDDLFFTWLATSRYHLGYSAYRVYSSRLLDRRDEVFCHTNEAAEIELRRLAVAEYRLKSFDKWAWSSWPSSRCQNAALDPLM